MANKRMNVNGVPTNVPTDSNLEQIARAQAPEARQVIVEDADTGEKHVRKVEDLRDVTPAAANDLEPLQTDLEQGHQ